MRDKVAIWFGAGAVALIMMAIGFANSDFMTVGTIAILVAVVFVTCAAISLGWAMEAEAKS